MAQKMAAPLASALVSECLKGRQKTVELATEAMLLLCELENGGAVVDALVKEGFSHKVKKLVPLAIDCATAALRAFGPQDFPPQLLLKSFPELFLSADAKIRDSAKALVIELRRWLGAVLDKPVETLRPAQAKELKAAFDEMANTEKAKPTRLTRSKQKVAAASGSSGSGSGAGGGAAEAAAPAFDPFAMIEPQEVADKVPAAFFEQTSDKNWKARSEALDKLVALADVPRIKPGDFGPIVAVLKKLIAKDANVIVVAKAAQAVALLAAGLRADFAPYAKSTVPVILEKFKEKKASVIQQLHLAMDPISMYCFPLKDKEAMEIVGEALKSKIPNAKIETMTWLVRAMSSAKPEDVAQALKLFVAMLMETLNDSSPEVRDLGCHVLAWLEIRLGEKRMKPYFATLDKIKAAKVAEFVAKEKENAGAAKAGGAAPTSASVVAAPAPVAAAAVAAAAPAPVAARTAAKAVPAAAKPAVVASVPVAKIAGPRVWTEDSAVTAGLSLISDEVRALLKNENFKERVKGMTMLTDLSEDALSADGGMTYPLMASLSQLCGGFVREANFQVIQALFDLAARLASHKGFDSNVVRYVAPVLLDKLGDFKLQKSASTCLDALVCATSVDTVFHALYAPLETTKNAKAVPNVLKWMQGAVEEYGLAPAFSSADLVTQLSKSVLNNKQAPFKKAGVVLLGAVYKNVARNSPEEEALTKAVAGVTGVEPAVIQQIGEQFTLAGSAPPTSPAVVPRMAGGPGPSFVKAGAAAPAASTSQVSESAVAVAEPAPLAARAASAAPAAVIATPLARNDEKATRARGPAWKVVGEHDAAAVQQLGKELIDCASLDLIRHMTGSSHADVNETAKVLSGCIQYDWSAVVDCSDVILKWVTLRLHDRDSVTVHAGLDVLRKLADAMAAKDARLESYEASFFVPALVEATGLTSDHAVAMAKEVLLTFAKVHPASKLFATLMHAVSAPATKPRTRRECLDLAATLIRRQGLTVASSIGHADLVMQVAAHLNDGEGAMRKSAADMLEVLEERLGSAEMLQMLHPVALRDQVAKTLLQNKHQASPQRDAALHASHDGHKGVSVPFSGPTHQWWEAVQNGDENGVVDAIKGLCADMESLAGQKNGANGTVAAIVARLWPSRAADGMRVRKYLVNGLLTVVSHRGCALKIERATVDAVVRSVLGELCGPIPSGSAQQTADRQAFLKALNVMMFRLLENCRPQLTCAVLVTLLTESIDVKAKSDYVPSKSCDLTMKCLVKLSKSLSVSDPTTVEGGLLHWEMAVRAIDAFFTVHPPAVWKTRANDMPLKAVKTTLSHLCKSLGSELLALIDSCVPALENGPAVIRQYADLMIKAAGKESASSASSSAASKVDEALHANAASNTVSGARTVENADPNPPVSESMTRLIELRRRFGLEHVPISTEDSAETAAGYQAASEAAEKKIMELRSRLQAVRAPYESDSGTKAWELASTNNNNSVTKSLASASPAVSSASVSSAPSQANDAQAQLAAIRERLAKFQQK